MMPLYEFKCSHCGAKFETLCSNATAQQGVKCVSCGSEGAQKIFSTFGYKSGSSSKVSTGSGSGGGCSSCGTHNCSSCH
ncbi:MAG: FmdB family zinc ribbon protein [Syntrophothermus sp.]